MSEFDLDLRAAEEEMATGQSVGAGDVELAILDGTTRPEEWVEAVAEGRVLVLSVEGDLNELAAPFAREIRERGGTLMHFRDMLIVTPDGVDIDTSRLA